MSLKIIIKNLGPGLLYAGAAIGVSHLVQSTRAGAGYGFDLLWILIIANIIKYPFFEFAPRYAASTGKSLIDGYHQTGKWAVILFAILTLGTMFTIQAAVTVVTAGLIGNVFNLPLNVTWISAIILLLLFIILTIGRFRILDNMIKAVIVILAITTLTATVAAICKDYNPNPEIINHFNWTENIDIFFLIAFIGWMPAPIDVSVWQSLWTVAKNKELGFTAKLKTSLLDFRIGYIGTAMLAISFMTLGESIIYGTNEELSDSSVVFAGQLIDMFTSSIGNWAYYIIALAAITTMFSTTLTCLDAYPRVMKPITKIVFPQLKTRKTGRDYESWFWMVFVAAGAIILLGFLSNSMQFMVDLATTLSFITAPLLAYLNYRVVTDKHFPAQYRPNKWLRIYAIAGIVFLSAFTLFYLFWNFIYNEDLFRVLHSQIFLIQP